MRKRRGIIKRYQPIEKEIKQIKISKTKTKIHTVLVLVGIFGLILFLTCFFNYNSGTVYNPNGQTLGERFYLSGPDPYLNMRTVEETIKQGRYPFISPHTGDYDQLLNYPIGERGSRPPLFNMIAVGTSILLQPFTSQIDAMGLVMLFLPAIYGALLVFPIYGIAKNLFNRKVGLLSALFVALIPIHIGGSHGSTLSLFDHDSFLLLLFACIFYFVIKSLKEQNIKKSICYSGFAGLFVGMVYLSWTASQFIFTLLLLSLVVLIIFDLMKSQYNLRIPLVYLITFIVALFVSLPWIIVHQDDIIGFPTMCLIATMGIIVFQYILKRYKLPWIVSLPSLGVLGGIGFTFLYLIHLGVIKATGAIQQLSITIFGEGIYGSKVSLTVAEAHNFEMSQTILSFGPALFYVALTGFVLYLIKTHKEKWQPINIFIITIFIVDFWLSTTAGRFLNDLIPTMTIFSAFCVFLILEKINLKQIISNMYRYEGLRKRKAVHFTQICGICFILFLVVLPNSFLVIDAAVPAEMKEQIFGQGYAGAFGNSNSKTIYWVDALSWLNKQDIEITNDADKPAFISWWDYGFYEAAIAHHPTVADNYQVGLYAAGNFKLATTEEEAVSVLIVRCCEGNKVHNNNQLTEEVKEVIKKYLPPTTTPIFSNTTNTTFNYTTFPAELMVQYIEDSTTCPSYNMLIVPEYGNTVLRKRSDNAMYHDCWKLMQNLTDEEITNFYKDIQKTTNYSIRYYGTEQYDTQIFGVFTFLTDRGTQGFVTIEDDYFIQLYEDTNTGYKYEQWQVEKWTQDQFEGKNLVSIVERKQPIYDTLWYKTYYGIGEMSDNRLPTYNLRHFKLTYINPMVVISKYYEGATINGTITLEGQSFPYTIVYVFDEYGIPHDNCFVSEDGQFSLLVPAGNLTFRVYVGQTLNDLKQTQTLIVTEEEGRRLIPYNKTLSFNISYANMILNITNNKSNLILSIQGETYQSSYEYPFSSSYVLNLTDMIPDRYKFTITNSTGFSLYNESIYVAPGVNTKNVTIPIG